MNDPGAVRTHGTRRRLPALPRTVRLCRVSDVPDHVLRLAGAQADDDFWTVDVDAVCDRKVLSSHLPRSVGGDAAGDPCGHPPPGHASDLAASLCPTSWRILSEVTCLRVGACVECGDRPGPSVSPSWSWNDEGVEVVGTLLSIRSLCLRCFACERPAESTWRWPHEKRIARIAAIACVDVESVSERLALHAERIAAWAGRTSALDLSVLSGLGLRFRKSWSQQGDQLVSDTASSRIVGATLSVSRGMVEIA